MKARLLELLAAHKPREMALGEMVRKADTVCAEMVGLLERLDQPARQQILELLMEEITRRLAEGRRWSNGKVPPDVLEWARRTFNMEEFLAGVREIEETGGFTFEDFEKDLERAAGHE